MGLHIPKGLLTLEDPKGISLLEQIKECKWITLETTGQLKISRSPEAFIHPPPISSGPQICLMTPSKHSPREGRGTGEKGALEPLS